MAVDPVVANYADHKPLDLVLMGVWFDKIARGEKTVEHRSMSKRNVEVIFTWLRRGPPYVVRLRRGYTKISLSFQVSRVDINVGDEMFDIYLGARVV